MNELTVQTEEAGDSADTPAGDGAARWSVVWMQSLVFGDPAAGATEKAGSAI